MKFNPTWPQVALLLGLITAVVLSHVFAPAAVGAITSIVSTIVGAIFVDLKKTEKAASDSVAPVLELVKNGTPAEATKDEKGGQS